MPARRLSPAVVSGLADEYLATTPWDRMRLDVFAESIGICRNTARALLQPRRWADMTSAARAARFDAALKELEADAEHITLRRVALHLRANPNSIGALYTGYIRGLPPIRARRDRVAEAYARVLAEARWREDASIARVRAAAEVVLSGFPDLSANFWRRRALLPKGPKPVLDPSIGIVAPDGGAPLLRSRLRADIASVIWDAYQTECGRPGRPASAARSRFNCFLAAGRLLGTAVPDVRRTTLRDLQSAWLTHDLTTSTLQSARQGLQEVLDLLVGAAIEGADLNGGHVAAAAEWLAGLGIPERRSSEAALTAAESDALVAACGAVIQEASEEAARSGIDGSRGPLWAPAVSDWGLALLILVARFTGLRSQSLTMMRSEDLLEVGPSTYGLVWRHDKKLEEHLAFVPASVGVLMQSYASALTPIRDELAIDQLFVGPGPGGMWAPISAPGLAHRIQGFVRRRVPALADTSIDLSPAILRRTFATRALAEGRSIFAIAAQLGHKTIVTTLGYVRYDRREHPGQVASALDRFGRIVLDRWKSPVLLEDLDADEASALAADAPSHDCVVGLCRCEECVFVASGETPPPCQSCQFLATSPAFFPAWELDLARRKARVEALSADAALGTVAASEAAQIAEIARIFAYLQERVI
jgi:integrase